MNRSSNKRYIAKVYNQGQDWQVIISENEVKLTERWFSRYEPINENRERVFDFVQEWFNGRGTKSGSWIFL
jgi:hypothetical protein